MPKTNVVIKSLGLVVFLIAFAALIGVIFGYEGLRTWGRPVPMPLNVTLCLMAIGAALFLIGNNESIQR